MHIIYLKLIPAPLGFLHWLFLNNSRQGPHCYSGLATVQQVPAQHHFPLYKFQKPNEPVHPPALTCIRQHRASLGTPPPQLKTSETTGAALPFTYRWESNSLWAIRGQKWDSLLQTCWPCLHYVLSWEFQGCVSRQVMCVFAALSLLEEIRGGLG